ncbi:MAG: terminase family protein [SAR324 cluster bacterium]|nr:terminase family protein [SAR324 cluster bacterium]
MTKKTPQNSLSKVDWSKSPPLFKYQQKILALALKGDNIYITKSRQIGISYLMAWLILLRAGKFGRNQIVVSASKKQVGIIRNYLFGFCEQLFRITLKGKEETIIKSKEGKTAIIQWLSNNAITAQGYSGDVYFDEFPQNPNAQHIYSTLFPAASLADYTINIFGAVGLESSFAHRLFKGVDQYGKKTKKDSYKRICLDVYSAIKGGNKLLDLKKIRKLCTPSQFKQWYECQWIRSGGGIFDEALLKKCFFTTSNKNSRQVIIKKYCQIPPFKEDNSTGILFGYDPNGTSYNGDNQAFVVLDEQKDGKLYLLENHILIKKTPDWTYGHIARILSKYASRLRIISIDKSGPGARVYERMLSIAAKFPMAKFDAFDYGYKNKNAIAWHLEQLVSEAKLVINYNDDQVIKAFYSVKNSVTPSGKATIMSKRTGSDHGELFWAIANAAQHFKVDHSPLHQNKHLSIGLV